MPPTPSEARYIREHHFNAWNPHPQTQTLYSSPLGPIGIWAPINVFNVLALIGIHFDIPLVLTSIVLVFQAAFMVSLFLINPAVGTRRSVVFENPDGKPVDVSVRRPLFGRRSCETKVGVDGREPYTEYVSWWTRRKYRARGERALFVVG